jgi:hypothetical protein
MDYLDCSELDDGFPPLHEASLAGTYATYLALYRDRQAWFTDQLTRGLIRTHR